MNSVLNKIFLYVGFLLCISFLVSCGSGGGGGGGGGDGGAISYPLGTKLSITYDAHENPKHYTSQSNYSAYMALIVKNIGSTTQTISKMQFGVDNTMNPESNFTEANKLFKIVANNDELEYPNDGIICRVGIALKVNEECELLIKMNKVNFSPISQINFTILANEYRYVKIVKAHSYAYIAGNFTKTYDTTPIINSIPVSNTNCGINGDSPCAILEYDIENNTVKQLAQTNYAVYSITADDKGVLYVVGDFNAIYNDNTLLASANLDDPLNTMIIKINPIVSGNIIDFIHELGSGVEYPNGTLYDISFNNNKLYFAGSYSKLGNLVYTSGNLLFANYDITRKSWGSTFGDETNSINDAIALVNFDNQDNLYISGLYNKVSQFTMPSTGYNKYVINKCSESGDIYVCDNNPDDYLIGTTNYFPVIDLMFDNLGSLYVVGNFTSIGNLENLQNDDTSDTLILKLSTTTKNLDFPQILPSSIQTFDRYVNTIVPMDNSAGFYMAGWFSSVDNLINNFVGECGAAVDGSAYSVGTKGCIVAKYDATQNLWSNVMTTDGIINVIFTNTKLEIVDYPLAK